MRVLPENFRLIAFSGKMGAGKTTAATMLKSYSVLSFAEPLKSAARILFNFSQDQLTSQELKLKLDERYGLSPREALQWLGTDVFRARWPKFWVMNMRIRLERLIAKANEDSKLLYEVCIDDVRFEDEADMIRELGGTIIHVLGRTNGEGDITTLHKSEAGIMLKAGDVTLDNRVDGLEVLERKVSRLKHYILGE